MRVTLDLDEDILLVARSYAKGRSISLGKAVCELVRRGLGAPLRTRTVNGIQVVDLPPDSPRITTRRVKQLLDELE
jgi:hypothetical protein